MAEPPPSPDVPPDSPDNKAQPEAPATLLDSTGMPEVGKAISPAVTAEVDNFTGAAHVEYPIIVPLGRKGLTPKLSIKYSSSRANTWMGTGWDLSAGYIQRMGPRKGVPKYDDAYDTFWLSLNGAPPQELVYISSIDEYRHKIEGPFYRIKYYPSGPNGSNYWEVTDKTGVKMRFGSTVDSKIGRQRDLNPGVKNDTYCWYLDWIEDPNTNYMQLIYWRDQDANNTFQVYLQEVKYNGNLAAGFQPNQRITFTLQSADRPDLIYNYRGRFKMMTRKRLDFIEVWAGTGGTERVRRYQLQYTRSAIYNTRSQLTSVTLYGSDNTTYLAPTTFTYFDTWGTDTEPLYWG